MRFLAAYLVKKKLNCEHYLFLSLGICNSKVRLHYLHRIVVLYTVHALFRKIVGISMTKQRAERKIV